MGQGMGQGGTGYGAVPSLIQKRDFEKALFVQYY